ncbi:MAG: hypothetical protein ACREQW_04875 [Candidatus Binatia bacterium]
MTGGSVSLAVVVLFSFQALFMWADEWFYHRRRGLERWERWGHPLDSFVYLSALVVPALARPAPPWLQLYVILAVFSCLLVTKDEWVHTEQCAAGEHWVHAVLFLIHPSVLIFVGLLWVNNEALTLRGSLPVCVGVFACYQFARWSGRRDSAQDRESAGADA